MNAEDILKKHNDIEEDLNIQSDRFGNILGISGIVIIMIPIVIVTLILLKDNLYIDLFNGCLIKIHREKLLGDKTKVISAIKKIKKEDSTDYKVMCRNVNKITYSRCLKLDKTGPGGEILVTDGCYLKGSKIIYINFMNSEPDISVDELSEVLKKYSYESKNFWESKN